jgi:DNA-binding CsgD family transcriptional regulator
MNHFNRLLTGLFLLRSTSQCKQPPEPVPTDTTPACDDYRTMGNSDGNRVLASGPNPYLIIRYRIGVLLCLLVSFGASADPFLQKIEKATPANRVILILNYFDTCSVVIQNQAAAFRCLNEINRIGEKVGDEQLSRYCQFIKDTYAKNSALSNDQKAALFIAVGQKAEQNDDPQIAAVCQHFAGEYYFINEEYGKAFEYLLAADGRFRTIGFGNIPEISRYLYELAFNYYYFKEYEKTIRLLNEATRYPAFSDNLAIQTHNTMGLAYAKIDPTNNPDNLRRAESCYQKTRQVAAAVGDLVWIGIANTNLGDVYVQQNRLTAAQTAFRIDYEMGKKFGKDRSQPYATAVKLARVYLMRQQLDSCAYFLHESGRLSLIKVAKTEFGSNLDNEYYLWNYYEVARQYNKVVRNLPLAYAYLDSLLTIRERINKRYDVRQLDLANHKLLIQKHQSEVDKLQAQKNTQQLLFWITGAVLILVALFFFTLYRFVRIKRRQDQVINAEKEKSMQLAKQIVDDELQRAKADLTLFIDNLHAKDTLIDTLNADLERLSQNQDESNESDMFVEAQQSLLNSSLLTNDDWEEFQRRFERVHPSFFVKLKTHIADISPAEERLLALSKLNMNTRQMSRMLGISPDSIHKATYRLRKKLGTDGHSILAKLLN